MKGVLCGGEILFDFLSKDIGKGLADSVNFEKRPGGSIFNVAVGLRRLGVPTSFLVKIGMDEFSDGLFKVLKEEGIDTEWVIREKDMKITLAFAAINEAGKPEFRFCRDRAADTMLELKDVEKLRTDDYSIYHFGSISLLEEPSSKTYLEIMERFVKDGKITSFDPNIRPNLIKNREEYIDMVSNIIGKVDIVKMSDDDLEYLTGERDVEEGLKTFETKEEGIFVVTLGERGAVIRFGGKTVHVPAFKVKVEETTGCGDAFMSAIIYKVWKNGGIDPNWDEDDLREILIFSNAVSAIVATRYGAANSMPTLNEVEEFLERNLR